MNGMREEGGSQNVLHQTELKDIGRPSIRRFLTCTQFCTGCKVGVQVTLSLPALQYLTRPLLICFLSFSHTGALDLLKASTRDGTHAPCSANGES